MDTHSNRTDQSNRTDTHRLIAAKLVSFAAVLCFCNTSAHAEGCERGEFDSTFALLQQAIFAERGCNNSFCHGTAASGGLDLSPAAAYDNLVGRPSQTVPQGTVPGLLRVVPGQKDQSLLFLNLAARTLPDQWQAPLRGMPLGGLPPLSEPELDAVRLWIEGGAPREGVVPGTGELLDACLPPPEPVAIEPLDPPAPGHGVQIRMPRWILKAQSEREVCFASYYDVSEQVPEEFRGPGETFRFRRQQTRQDPLSHHLIVNFYRGSAAPDDPAWGEFTCRGGPQDGAPCRPAEIGACGAEAECGGPPADSVACHGFGPPDANIGLGSPQVIGKQKASTESTYPLGVYGELPLSGIVIWNSHAFNTTRSDGKLEAWLNFEFAAADEQSRPAQVLFDRSAIYAMDVPAFGAREVCNHHTFDPGARLFELSSHTHKRGRRFRTFLGKFACDGGPNLGAPCSPLGPDEHYLTPDLCAGARCVSRRTPTSGDCDHDLRVSVDEIVLAVNIALGAAAATDCPRADPDHSGEVSIDEIVAAVASVLAEELRDPNESLLYESFVYNDPVQLRIAPPLELGGSDSLPEERTLTYCALYDNGFSVLDAVKRRSTSPPTPLGFPDARGGPCEEPTGCIEGRSGEACIGTTDEERDASCDSRPDAGDGFCDACPLVGGVTSDDEMFILLGLYFED